MSSTPEPAPTEQSPEGSITIDRRLAWGLASAVGMAIGSVGTWFTAGPFSVAGTTGGGDGWFTLAIGVIAGILVALRRLPWLTLPAAIVALGISLGDAIRFLSQEDDGSEWFGGLALGWGIVLVIVAAVSLATWGAAALRATPTRQRAIAGVLIAAALAGAIALGITDRMDMSDNDEPDQTLSDTSDDPSDDNAAPADWDTSTETQQAEPAEPAPTTTEEAAASDDCNELGINGDVGNEGACTDENGLKLRLVDRGTTLTLNEISVRDTSVNMTTEIPGEVDGPSRASGTYAQITVTVRNEGSSPIRIEPGMFRLVTSGAQYTTDFEAMNEPGNSCVWDSEEVQPGNERTCWVAFDVSKKNAENVTANGNLYVVQPSDMREAEAKRRVGIIRLYK